MSFRNKPQCISMPNKVNFNSYAFNQLVQIKIKSNGHDIYNKIIPKSTASNEITYYLSNYKLPMSIYVADLNQDTQASSQKLVKSSCDNFHKVSTKQFQEKQQNNYDLDVLAQQIQLFESEQQIQQYISMQKLLAHNVQEKLTHLTKSIIQVTKIKNKKVGETNGVVSIADVQQSNITKQKLNQIQQKCMKTLTRVQEQRKKMDMCVICWQNSISVMFMPCMHLILCKKCPRPKKCPVCKQQILNAVNVFK